MVAYLGSLYTRTFFKVLIFISLYSRMQKLFHSLYSKENWRV